jgi:4-amino-4-deoxy-L-arabinose transferase-like glycosyltransferase
MKTFWPALLLLSILHAGLATAYSVLTPYREAGFIFGPRGKPPPPQIRDQARVPDIGAPDERQHANYIGAILRGEGIPVFKPGDQPPLYYILGAGYGKVLGVGEVESRSAGLRLRSFNALIGGLTVLGVFFLAYWGFGRVELGLAAAALAALLPMNVALSSAITNDPLLFCVCTWCLALAGRGFAQGWTMKIALGVGALIGVAALVKTTGIALVPALLLALIVAQRRPSAAQIAAAAGLALVLATPWWIRNHSLYGDPLAIGAFNQAFQGSPQASMFIQELGPLAYWSDWVGWWTARSFIGVFGYMDIFLADNLYRIALAVLFLLMVLGILESRREDGRGARGVGVLNTAFFVVVTVLFFRFNAQYFQGQARYLLPAVGPIALLFGFGFFGLFKNAWKVSFPALVLFLTGFNIYVLSLLPSAFAERTFGA